LAELKDTILQARRDQRENPQAISQALFLYNRYGDDSPALQVLSSDEIRAVSLEELLDLITSLKDYRHTLTYTGSLPVERVINILEQHHQLGAELRDPPPYQFRHARQISGNEIYVIDRETAQAQVR